MNGLWVSYSCFGLNPLIWSRLNNSDDLSNGYKSCNIAVNGDFDLCIIIKKKRHTLTYLGFLRTRVMSVFTVEWKQLFCSKGCCILAFKKIYLFIFLDKIHPYWWAGYTTGGELCLWGKNVDFDRLEGFKMLFWHFPAMWIGAYVQRVVTSCQNLGKVNKLH